MIYQLAAIGAGLCFAISPFLSLQAVKTLGTTTFNKWRMLIVFVMLSVMALLTGGWHYDLLTWWPIITLSALIGIFLGDTLLLSGLKRMGPRRNSVIFALNAPFTVFLGWMFLDEVLSLATLFATLIISSGVITAIAFGRKKPQHSFEEVQGKLLTGIAITLASAICQASSLILLRPAMESGIDPIATSALRMGIAAACLWTLTYLSGFRKTANSATKAPLTPMLLLQISASGLFAMGIGMSLLLFGLSGGNTGVISTLSSISPIIALPILWVLMKKPPSLNAWIGAALVVTGTSILFLS